MTLSYAISDSATMLGRSLRHGFRYPLMLLTGLLTPVVLLLMFVYLLGGALTASVGTGAYIDYITPSILLLTACYGGSTTAVTVSVDLTEGVVNRFRTMAIFRPSVLVGHVLGGVLRTLCAIVLVLGVALLMGYRSPAGPSAWLAAAGLLALLTFALTWLTIAVGSSAKSPGGANSAALPLQLLPMVSSAVVPTASMPRGLRWFADHQPFTPIIDTLRHLLSGVPAGSTGWVAVAWCVALTAVGVAWSLRSFR